MINQRGEVEFEPRADRRICPLSRQFQEWVDGLAGRLGTTPSLPELARAKVLLTDRYFKFREAASSEHRDYAEGDHDCIYHAFVSGYERIRDIELSLPATLDLYSGLAPSQPRQVNALVLEDDTPQAQS